MEYYSALNRKTVYAAVTQMSFEEFMFSDMLTTKDKYNLYLYEIPRNRKIQRQKKRDWQGQQESGELLLQEHRASSVFLPPA